MFFSGTIYLSCVFLHPSQGFLPYPRRVWKCNFFEGGAYILGKLKNFGVEFFCSLMNFWGDLSAVRCMTERSTSETEGRIPK